MGEILKPSQGDKSVNQAEREALARGDKVVKIGRREFIAGGIVAIGTAAAGFFGIRKALNLYEQNRALQQEINALKQNPSSPPQPSTENIKTAEQPQKRFEAIGTGPITHILDAYKNGDSEQRKEIKEQNPEIIQAYEDAQKTRSEIHPILKDNDLTPNIEDIGIDISAIKDMKENRIYVHWVLRDGKQKGQRNTIFIPKTQGEEKSIMKVSVGLPDDLKSGFVQHPSGEVTATIFHWTPTNNNGVFNELLNGEVTASKADASYKQFQKPLDYTAIKEYPTFIMLSSDKLPPVKQGEGNIKFEEIKPLKKLTAETKEISENMIVEKPLKEIEKIFQETVDRRENKYPIPVSLQNGAKITEYTAQYGIQALIITGLQPGNYELRAPYAGVAEATSQQNIKGSLKLSFTEVQFYPEKTIKDSQFASVTFLLPKDAFVKPPYLSSNNQSRKPYNAGEVLATFSINPNSEAQNDFNKYLNLKNQNASMVIIPKTATGKIYKAGVTLKDFFLVDEKGKAVALSPFNN